MRFLFRPPQYLVYLAAAPSSDPRDYGPGFVGLRTPEEENELLASRFLVPQLAQIGFLSIDVEL